MIIITKEQLTAAASIMGRVGGRVSTPAKAAAARRNGLLAGRPRSRYVGYAVVASRLKRGRNGDYTDVSLIGDNDNLSKALIWRSRCRAQAWIDQEKGPPALFLANEIGEPEFSIVRVGDDRYRLAAKETFGMEAPPVKEIR